jgi:AcrR family transcriptional regulator
MAEREVPERKGRTPRQPRARATVDAILVAAAHILKTEGRERLNTNRVAELAGVSVGSLYQYFPNKEAVLHALRERYGAWFDAALHEEIDKGDVLPLRAAVRSAVDRILAMHRLDLNLHDELSADERPLSADELRGFRARMQSYLEANAASLRPLDPALASYVGTRAMEALLHGTAHDEPEWLDHPGFAEEVTELLVRYLSP